MNNLDRILVWISFVFFLSWMVDVDSTLRVLSLGGFETNPIVAGIPPSPLLYAFYAAFLLFPPAIVVSTRFFVLYLAKRLEEPRFVWVLVVPYMILLFGAWMHFDAAIHNYGLLPILSNA